MTSLQCFPRTLAKVSGPDCERSDIPELRDAIIEQTALAAHPLGAIFDFVAPESNTAVFQALYKVRFGHLCHGNNLALFLGPQRFMPTTARLSWIMLNLRLISVNLQSVLNPRSIDQFKAGQSNQIHRLI
jgi:hypothetical protein